MNSFSLLIIIALVCAVVSLLKPTWPLASCAIIFICVGLLIGH